MKFYETTYIAHSALQAGRLDDLTKSINDKVASLGGEILFSESWGRKKLAYLIDKQKYGTYVYIQFQIKAGNKLPELVQEFDINSNILRHLIVSIEAEDIMESTDNIEDELTEKAQDDNKKIVVEDKNLSSEEPTESKKIDSSEKKAKLDKE